MKLEHTPGPFTAEKVGRGHWSINCSHQHLNDSRRTDIVAEIKDPIGYMHSDENRANAHLLASAPDLLAGCKAALANMIDFADATDLDMAVRAKLEAAIAKAEGTVADAR